MMGVRIVHWNPVKRRYDLILAAGVISYIALFMILGLALYSGSGDGFSPEILMIRALGSCAFIMLHIVLMIGPLARLSPRFKPLLYNRRHFGVMLFFIGLFHGLLATIWYSGFGTLSPFENLFAGQARYDNVIGLPFEVLGIGALMILFLMALTSHDFWLAKLTPPVWKALHMGVYLAYALLVMHVALGILQDETHPGLGLLLAAGIFLVGGSHIAADLLGRTPVAAGTVKDGWVLAGALGDFDGDKPLSVRPGADAIAVWKHAAGLSATSAVCAHQNGPLNEGCLKDGLITCPWHGFQYDPATGQSPPPYTEKLPTHRVRLEGENIWVEVDAQPPGTPLPPAAIGGT